MTGEAGAGGDKGVGPVETLAGLLGTLVSCSAGEEGLGYRAAHCSGDVAGCSCCAVCKLDHQGLVGGYLQGSAWIQ